MAQLLDDVAPSGSLAAIERVVRKPRAETWVPNWIQGPTKLTQALPRRVQEAVARLTGADNLLAQADPAARAAYEARARSQGRAATAS